MVDNHSNTSKNKDHFFILQNIFSIIYFFIEKEINLIFSKKYYNIFFNNFFFMNQPKYNYEREKYLEVYALFATLQQKSTQETLSQHEIIENVRKRIQELSLDEKYFHAQYRNLKSEFSR